MTMFKPIREKIIERLKNELDPGLSFHNAGHTAYVLHKAVYIARKEKVSGKELLLVKLAALYHDTGFLVSYTDHEEHSCRIAGDELNHIPGLTEADVSAVCAMIRATKIPQRPKTLLEKIIADADLEYLSTRCFDEFSKRLYTEMKYLNPGLEEEQWRLKEISFMENHHYHTDYFRRVREPVKRNIIEKIKSRRMQIT
jgi:uncharacterized protein